MRKLYLFVDESGNFDFDATGTKHFMLTVLCTTDPAKIALPLMELRYQLLEETEPNKKMIDDTYFHATEDKQLVRDQVFTALTRVEAQHFRIDSVIARKKYVRQFLRENHDDFYKKLGGAVLKYAFNRAQWQGYEKIVVCFSSLFTNQRRKKIKESFSTILQKESPVPFTLHFAPTQAEFCNQAVDYFGWAIYRKYELGDTRSYDLIKIAIKSEFQIY